MQILSITGQGLRWIAALVLLLWVCVVAEDVVVRHARRDTGIVLVQLRRMREGQRSLRVSHPQRGFKAIAKPAIG